MFSVKRVLARPGLFLAFVPRRVRRSLEGSVRSWRDAPPRDVRSHRDASTSARIAVRIAGGSAAQPSTTRASAGSNAPALRCNVSAGGTAGGWIWRVVTSAIFGTYETTQPPSKRLMALALWNESKLSLDLLPSRMRPAQGFLGFGARGWLGGPVGGTVRCLD